MTATGYRAEGWPTEGAPAAPGTRGCQFLIDRIIIRHRRFRSTSAGARAPGNLLRDYFSRRRKWHSRRARFVFFFPFNFARILRAGYSASLLKYGNHTGNHNGLYCAARSKKLKSPDGCTLVPSRRIVYTYIYIYIYIYIYVYIYISRRIHISSILAII